MRIPSIPTSLMIGISALVVMLIATLAHADPRTDCPSPVPCKVITLTIDEEKALVDRNMVLDTASQGRLVDLGNISAYFRNKIAAAPMGDAPRSPASAGEK